MSVLALASAVIGLSEAEIEVAVADIWDADYIHYEATLRDFVEHFEAEDQPIESLTARDLCDLIEDCEFNFNDSDYGPGGDSCSNFIDA